MCVCVYARARACMFAHVKCVRIVDVHLNVLVCVYVTTFAYFLILACVNVRVNISMYVCMDGWM